LNHSPRPNERTEAPGKEHWTRILYLRHPEFYLPIVEARMEMGAREAERVAKVLSDAGLPPGGRILDLACGIGRHAIPLAKMGYEVVGCDLSPAFINRARKHATSANLPEERIRFYEADMREIDTAFADAREEPFDAIVSMFSSLGAYGEGEDSRLVRSLLALSSARCLLLTETLNRDFLLKRFQPFGIHRLSQKLRLLELARFNFETSMLEDDWRFYSETTDGTLRLELDVQVTGRVYTLQEMKKLAEGAGWRYLLSSGSLMAPGPVSSDTPSIVLLCQKS
jgi:SAM-dependent methyltransferase